MMVQWQKNTGKYAGLDRYECRKQLIEDLKQQGYLISIEDHEHAVGHCSRCSTTVEPLVSKQWFVKMESLAKPAAEAVKSGKIKFVPERFSKIYCNLVRQSITRLVYFSSALVGSSYSSMVL